MNKAKKMEALVSAYQKSGMGPKEFSAKQGISVYQLKYWVKKLKQGPSSKAGFIELSPKELTSKSRYTVSHSVEINYPNGVLVKLTGSDFSLISQLISLY